MLRRLIKLSLLMKYFDNIGSQQTKAKKDRDTGLLTFAEYSALFINHLPTKFDSKSLGMLINCLSIHINLVAFCY